MIQLKFRIKMLISYGQHHKLLNVMTLLTLVVALLFPCMVISDYLYAKKKEELFPEILPNIEIRFQGNYDDAYAIEEKLKELKMTPMRLGRSTLRPRNLIFYKNKYILSHLVGVDETIFDEYYTLHKGRGFTKEEQQRGEKVALVSYRSYLQNKMKLGDKVVISGSIVEIIGVVFHEFSSMSLILPEKTMKEVNLASDYTVELFLWEDRTFSPEEYLKEIGLYFPQLSDLRITHGQNARSMRKFYAKQALYEILAQGLFSLLFSSSCFWFMNRARLTQQRKIWGIKRSQGSTALQLVFDGILDTLLLSIPALFIAWSLLVMGRAFFSRISALLLTVPFFISSFMMTVLFSILLGAFSGYAITQENILTMLEEG